MATFDEETLLKSISNLYYNYINDYLNDIDSEKNDGISTPQLDVDNGIIYDLNAQDILPNPFLWNYITTIDSESVRGGTLREVCITPTIFYTDDYNDQDTIWKMMRYARALREIIEIHFGNISECDSLTVQSLPILEYIKESNKKKYKIVGINIKTTIL